MIFFIQPALMASFFHTTDIPTIVINDYSSADYDFIASNASFLSNLTENFNFYKQTSIESALQIIISTHNEGINTINSTFADANKRLLNELFTEVSGNNIEEIKNYIYNDEYSKISTAIKTKMNEVKNSRTLFHEQIISTIQTLIGNLTSSTSNIINFQLDEEFKNYIARLVEMNNSGDIHKILLGKTKILKILDDKFDEFSTSIETSVNDITDQFLTTAKGKCQEEDEKTTEIVRLGDEELEKAVLDSMTVAIVDNYKEITESVKKDVEGSLTEMFNVFKIRLNNIPPIFKEFFNNVGETIRNEQAIQSRNIAQMLRSYNDEVVNEIMN